MKIVRNEYNPIESACIDAFGTFTRAYTFNFADLSVERDIPFETYTIQQVGGNKYRVTFQMPDENINFLQAKQTWDVIRLEGTKRIEGLVESTDRTGHSINGLGAAGERIMGLKTYSIVFTVTFIDNMPIN